MNIISLFYLSTFNNIERDNNTILGGNSPHFSNKQRIFAVAVIEDNQLRSCHKPSKETQRTPPSTNSFLLNEKPTAIRVSKSEYKKKIKQ
jgi:hypothetical protein